MALSRVAHRSRQHGYDLEHIADDAIVGDLEDRCFTILVDRDDRPRRSHTGKVLHRAGNAERDVEVGTHGAARLADLIAVRTPAIVAHCACAPYRGAPKRGCELFRE